MSAIAIRAAPVSRWQIGTNDCGLQVTVAERVARAIPRYQTSTHTAADRLQLKMGRGTRAHLIAMVSSTPVIDELTVEVPVRCERSGLRVYARIILPRSRDATTNQPMTILLPGPQYVSAGKWETLLLGNLTAGLEDRVRVMRSQMALPIDSREAFVDAVVADAYCDFTELDLWLGDPTIGGFEPSGLARSMQHLPPVVAETPIREIAVRTSGGILEVDGRPFFARVIEACGEDWGYLRDLGFNALRLRRPITAADLAAARRYQLWLIAPPPSAAQWRLIRDHCESVLVWDLSTSGAHLTDEQWRMLSDSVQSPSSAAYRPFACELSDRAEVPSRVDVVIVAPQAKHYHHDSLCWPTVHTGMSDALCRQLSWFGVDPASVAPDVRELQQRAFSAAAEGARGIVFLSSQRLDEPTRAAQQRSLAMRQINQLLEAISPWLAGGIAESHLVPDVREDSASIAQPWRRRRGRVFVKTAARLGLMGNGESDLRGTVSPLHDAPSRFTINVGAVGSQVFYLHPESFRQIPSRMVPGGVEITIDDPHEIDAVVVAGEPGVVEGLARRWARGHAQRLEDALELARISIEETSQVCREINDSRSLPRQAWVEIEQARAAIKRAKHASDNRRWSDAWQHLRRADSHNRVSRQGIWNHLAPSDLGISCPLTTRFASLARYASWSRSAPFGSHCLNVLPSGGCEDIHQMSNAGWQVDAPTGELQDIGSVSAEVVHDGQGALRIMRSPPQAHSMVSAVPTRLISAAVPLTVGQMVRIQGWTKIRAADPAWPPKLSVFDSFAGQELAERVHRTRDWQPFTLYRVADSTEPLRVTFEMEGAGTFFLDQIAITVGPKMGAELFCRSR